MTAVSVDGFISLKRKPSTLLCAVIAGELGCLSLITYILCPPPAAIGLSDFHHPLPMFSLTPCIYNMLEQPLECKDPTEALSKHSPAGFTYTHAGAMPRDTTRKVLSGRIGKQSDTW